jgi:hypothetical protein
MNSHPRNWSHSSHHHPHSNWRPPRGRSRTQLGNPKARRRRLRQCRSRQPPNRRPPHRHRSRKQLAGIVDAQLPQRSRETTGDRRAPGRSRSTARRRAAQTSRRRAGPYTRRSWLRSQSFQGSIGSWLFSITICPLAKIGAPWPLAKPCARSRVSETMAGCLGVVVAAFSTSSGSRLQR